MESSTHLIYSFESQIINYIIDTDGNVTYTDSTGATIPVSEIKESKQLLVNINGSEENIFAKKGYVTGKETLSYNTTGDPTLNSKCSKFNNQECYT